MKTSAIILSALLLSGYVGTLSAATYRGDVNGDGKVDMADMQALADVIRSGTADSSKDLNADGKTDNGDLSYLADLIILEKLVEDSGLNVGIGGWDDDGEDYGGTVGGMRSARSGTGISMQNRVYDFATGMVSYDIVLSGAAGNRGCSWISRFLMESL